MTKELWEAIKSKLGRLEPNERRHMIEGLRYGFNLALTASSYAKQPLAREPIVREFFD